MATKTRRIEPMVEKSGHCHLVSRIRACTSIEIATRSGAKRTLQPRLKGALTATGGRTSTKTAVVATMLQDRIAANQYCPNPWSQPGTRLVSERAEPTIRPEVKAATSALRRL